jgi:hypothetical protein
METVNVQEFSVAAALLSLGIARPADTLSLTGEVAGQQIFPCVLSSPPAPALPQLITLSLSAFVLPCRTNFVDVHARTKTQSNRDQCQKKSSGKSFSKHNPKEVYHF